MALLGASIASRRSSGLLTTCPSARRSTENEQHSRPSHPEHMPTERESLICNPRARDGRVLGCPLVQTRTCFSPVGIHPRATRTRDRGRGGRPYRPSARPIYQPITSRERGPVDTKAVSVRARRSAARHSGLSARERRGTRTRGPTRRASRAWCPGTSRRRALRLPQLAYTPPRTARTATRPYVPGRTPPVRPMVHITRPRRADVEPPARRAGTRR